MTKQKLTTYAPNDVERHIGLIKRDAEKLKVKIHAIAMSVLKAVHDGEHNKGPKDGQRDREWGLSMLTALLEASPYHGRSLATWINVKVPFVQWSDDRDAFVVNHNHDKFMGKEFMDARDNPFWEVSPPPKARPMNIYDEIDNLIAKADRATQKPKDGQVVDQGAINQLRKIAALRPAEPAKTEDKTDGKTSTRKKVTAEQLASAA